MKMRKLLLGGLLAGAALPLLASAAPTVGPAGSAFYTPPTTLPAGSHGDLVWYRPAVVNLGAGAPGLNAWNVLYRSTDAVNAGDVVTGTVLVPSAAWTGSGARPIISYAVGTHGLAQGCAPSMQMAAGSDYEAANLGAALKAGYAVLVSDYQGYTNGSTPTYLAGASQGHAVLDIITAATQIPGTGLSASAQSAVWGYSQGGQSAAWAGELYKSYAPGLKLAGIAAGGIPADFEASAAYLDGSTGASFLLGGVIGLGQQYPTQIPLTTLANANGQAAITVGKSQCVFQSLFTFMNHKLSEYTVGNKTLAQLEAVPAIDQTLKAQNLGTNAIPVPMYQYHGQADEFLPLDQDIALKKTYCNKWDNVTFAAYPGEHITTQFQAAPYVLSWLADRFAGKLTLGNCIDFAAQPKSTANAGGGNFVVSLNSWILNGTMGLKTLAQTVTLPSGSTFTANTDMTAQTISGTLAIPTFTTNLKIVGLPADVQLQVSPTGPTTGTATLDNAGLLHVHGHAKVNITVVSAGESILQIPFGCVTSSPVDLPINFDGPISSLGNGNLAFGGTTTFPDMTGCGAFTGLFTTLMSGPGQTFAFAVAPPAPVGW